MSGGRPPGPVLACVDGSAYDPGVCETAAWLAARLAQPVTLLHRPARPNSASCTDPYAGPAPLLVQAAAERVRSAGARLAAPQPGPHDFAAAAAVASRRAGVLVLGRRGRSTPVYSLRFGANVAPLLARAECPICLAPRSASPPRRALVLLETHPLEAMTDLLVAHPALDGVDCVALRIGQPARIAEPPHRMIQGFLRTSDCDLVVLPRGALLAEPRRRELEGLLIELNIAVLVPGRGRLTVRRT